MTPAVQRYHRAAIALHWVMAVAIFAMLVLGLTMAYAPLEKMQKFQIIQWHKSLGVLVLIAIWIRIAIRLIKPHPALPEEMSARDRKLATLGHWALYAWMVALPLTGWLLVSTSKLGLPTIVFGWFEWPHIPGTGPNEPLHELAENAHALLSYSLIALILGHVAAVIKHAKRDHINLLPRMGIGHQK